MIYRILSLDGGGIRGVLTAQLLCRIDQEDPGFLKSIDLFAGTSTGSIIASALAMELSPQDIVRFYKEKGSSVFNYNLKNKIRSLGGLLFSRYRTTPLQMALYDVFGKTLLWQVKHKLLLSSFQLDNHNPIFPSNGGVRSWKAKFFHNFCESTNKDVNTEIVELILRSCSAPIFFPIHNGFVDGGVCANNPAMCAVAQAIHVGNNIADLRVCSLGTGDNPQYIDALNKSWGLLQWNIKAIDMLLDSDVGLVDYQCREILGNNYYRFNPILCSAVGLDDASKIDVLIEIANQLDIDPIISWINKN